MTTTTMDLHGVSAVRADRKTSASGVLKRPASASHVALVTASQYVDTARGRPPPAYYERFVHRVAWTFCVVGIAWVFGGDLARWLWSLIW